MIDMKLMETKPHTYEVTHSPVHSVIGKNITIETDKDHGGWFIRIVDMENSEHGCVCLDAADAIAVAEFITNHVRKRW